MANDNEQQVIVIRLEPGEIAEQVKAAEDFKKAGVVGAQPARGYMPIKVNKRTHRIRFEDETEDSVTIWVEPKGNP